MEKKFIESTIQVATYKLKEGTSTSYYWQKGSTILPNRISFTLGKEITEAKHKGRMLNKEEKVIGEVDATFKKDETSPLKQYKPYNIHSKVFQSIDFPQLTGYATLAVTNEEGKCKNEEGLLVIVQESESVLTFFYVAGVTCNPGDKMLVCEVVLSMAGLL